MVLKLRGTKNRKWKKTSRFRLFYTVEDKLISQQGSSRAQMCSAAEAVEGAALSLESVDNVEGGDGLSLGVFSVGHGVTDDVLEEGAEDGAGLLVDVGGDSLDTTTAGESADGGLGDAHDGLLKGSLGGVALGALLAALSFSTDLGFCWHFKFLITTADAHL